MWGELQKTLHLAPANSLRLCWSDSAASQVRHLWQDLLQPLNHSLPESRLSQHTPSSVTCMTDLQTITEKPHRINPDRPYVCDECGKNFLQAADLARHNRVHSGEKPYSCEQCGRSFAQKGDLTRHTRVHTGEKPYTCIVCRKCFTQSGDLTRHLRVHTGEKPFSCGVCLRNFSQSGDSIRHTRVHSGWSITSEEELPDNSIVVSSEKTLRKKFSPETHVDCFPPISISRRSMKKQFSCSECDKSFYRASDLSRHTRIHSGEKLFSCDDCGKSFFQSSDLNRHKLVHSGEKPFSCDACGKRCARSSDLIRHKRIHNRFKFS